MRNLLLLLILFSGCVVVTPDEMRRAEAACKTHGGLSHITANPFYETDLRFTAYCHDGTAISKMPERGKK